MPTRIAVIGAGALANQMHYPSLAALPEVDLVAACDLQADKLAATAARFAIPRTYADYRTMLAEVEAEAVHVLMPPHHLFDIAVAVLDSGRHLFIEKPPCVTLTQITNLARLAERKGLLTMVGFNRRFAPVLAACRGVALERGPIEQAVVTFHKHHFGGEYYRGAVDILTCDAIHAVDLLRHLGGEVTRVQASVRRCGGEDYANSWHALLDFENGACGLLLAHFVGGKRFHHAEFHAKGLSCFTAFEREGTVWADGREEPLAHFDAAELAGSDEPYRMLGFYQENQHFAQCVAAGRQPLTNFAEAARTMALVDQILHAG
jgi:predicted dehydrogenase